jgi:hypothetical protein
MSPMNPYHHLEGNIEIANPFYSGLMLERKSIDGLDSLAGGNSSFGKSNMSKKHTNPMNPFLVS